MLLPCIAECQAAAIAEMTDDSSDDDEDNHFVNGPGASQPPPSSLTSDDAKDPDQKPSKGAVDRAPSDSQEQHLAAKIKPSIGPSSWHWHWSRVSCNLRIPSHSTRQYHAAASQCTGCHSCRPGRILGASKHTVYCSPCKCEGLCAH